METIEGVAKMWGVHCQIVSNASSAGLALGKKVRQSARINALLSELKRSCVGHICDSRVEHILCRTDLQIDRWIRTNEKLLKKVKKDPNQPTLRKFFRGPSRVGQIHKREFANANSDTNSATRTRNEENKNPMTYNTRG